MAKVWIRGNIVNEVAVPQFLPINCIKSVPRNNNWALNSVLKS